MKLLTFKGGVHPQYNKEYSEKKAIEKVESPKVVYIPLQQHIGAPAKAIVKVGEKVKLGQKIGEQEGFVSCNVHSSVSGKVIGIEEHELPGGRGMCIIIENDFKDEVHENVIPNKDIENLTKEEIVNIVKEAGIVGMGGATFPTHVKISPPQGKNIDTVILNGAKCEPYLTADHRIMLENPEDVVYGLYILMKALDVKKGYIGIEVNKLDAIEAIEKEVKKYENIEVSRLEIKYPQGAEKQLIYACTKREVPSGGLPMDVGVVVNNVATAAQINLVTRVGTLVSEIIEQCGGFKEGKTVGKIIIGGPMMGIAQYTINIPINKGASGIVCLDKQESKTPNSQNCLRCGKCLDVCPAFLQPLYISAYSLKNDYESAESYRALDCIECGSCSFICPARRPLLQSIRKEKREIIVNKKGTY